MEDLIKLVAQGIMALFIIGVLIFTFLPELGKVTGQNMTIYVISFFLLGVAIILAIVKGFMDA